MDGCQQRIPSKPSEIKGEEHAYLNNICLTLSDAISRGDKNFASNLAQQLAAQKAAVKIRLDDPDNEELARGAKDNKIKFV